MMQAPLEHNRFAQNSVIKDLLIAALDATSSEIIEQNLVIRDFLITEEREHHNEF